MDVIKAYTFGRDRGLTSGDTTGEPVADRESEALPYLLLETNGSRGDQLLGVLIKEENHRYVDLENAAQPPEQLGEELLGIQVGEVSFRQRPQVLQPLFTVGGVDAAHPSEGIQN